MCKDARVPEIYPNILNVNRIIYEALCPNTRIWNRREYGWWRDRRCGASWLEAGGRINEAYILRTSFWTEQKVLYEHVGIETNESVQRRYLFLKRRWRRFFWALASRRVLARCVLEFSPPLAQLLYRARPHSVRRRGLGGLSAGRERCALYDLTQCEREGQRQCPDRLLLSAIIRRKVRFSTVSVAFCRREDEAYFSLKQMLDKQI